MEPNTDFELEQNNKTDRNLLLQKFEELQQQHQQSLSETTAHPNHTFNSDSEDFDDIQFFQRLPQLQPIKMGMGGGSDVVRGAIYDFNNTSENPFVFPDNVMEYGEPQFFPGNYVGYLETIQETDEEYDDEEGCSGRHWWTADSDTDTDSVIRVDHVTPNNPANNSHEGSQCQNSAAHRHVTLPENQSNNSALFSAAPFRTTASSKPFEMEDLYLFDQLDLAFEETLTKPRARSGFALGGDDSQPIGILPESSSGNNAAESPEAAINGYQILPNGHVSPTHHEPEGATSSSDDEQPAEVNEEDFFYSTSEENSSLTETTTSESEDTSSDEGGNKDGVVLAEFSLTAGFNNGLFKSHRRSFEGTPSNSKLKSFRSFDSLNSLAGTELLFSKADTFPSFHEFMKEAGDSSATPSSIPGSDDADASSDTHTELNEKVEVTRKSSGEMSTENLSEDSGICDGSGSRGGFDSHNHNMAPPTTNFIAKSVFALNPLLYSSASASEENSIVSVGSNHSFETHNPNGGESNPDNRLFTNTDSGSSQSQSHLPNSTDVDANADETRSTSPNPSATQEFLSNANNTIEGNFPTITTNELHPSSSTTTTTYLEQTKTFDDKTVQIKPSTTTSTSTPVPVQAPAITKPNSTVLLPGDHEDDEIQPDNSTGGFQWNLDVAQKSDARIMYGHAHPGHVGGYSLSHNYDDEDEMENLSDAMFTMLEREVENYDYSGHDVPIDTIESETYKFNADTRAGVSNFDSNSNTTSTSTDAVMSTKIEMTSSSDISDASDVNTHVTNNSASKSGIGINPCEHNGNSLGAESESTKQCLLNSHTTMEDTITELYEEAGTGTTVTDGLGGASCVIKSGPMSTLDILPSGGVVVVEPTHNTEYAHTKNLNSHSILPAHTPLPTSVSVSMSTSPGTDSGVNVVGRVISDINMSKSNSKNNTTRSVGVEKGNPMDMDLNSYLDSLESEILSLTEVDEFNQAVAHDKKNSFGSKAKLGSSTTHPGLSSVSLEPEDWTDLPHLLPSASSKSNKSKKKTEKESSISGSSNFGKRAGTLKLNLREEEAGTGAAAEEIGTADEELPEVSEPLVVRRRTWNCAEELESGSEIVDDAQVPPKKSTSPNVPDILKIQSGMEVVERPRSISPRATTAIREARAGTQSPSPSPVPIKTYGSHGEVEVFLVSSRTPSPISPNFPGNSTIKMAAATGNASAAAAGTETGNPTPVPVVESGTLKSNKTVHFSPVVSEISWRESYTDQGSEFSESSTENHLMDNYQYGGDHGDEDDEDDEDTIVVNEDEFMNKRGTGVIERVHVQSQVIQEPGTVVQPTTTGENKPMLLSMVPDLLSQCENVNYPPQESHTHIEVKIEPKHNTNPSNENENSGIEFIQQPTQQQIFPTMFADTKDSKSGKSAPAKKSKENKKGFSLGKSKDKDKDKDKNKEKNNSAGAVQVQPQQPPVNHEKQEKEKPSFFQRLSKIRLSGSSGNKSKNKGKIHPKEKENEEPVVIGSKDEVDKKTGPTTPTAPILKKQQQGNGAATSAGGGTPADTSTIYTNKNGHAMTNQVHEGEECSAAFESILEEIAGLNTIRQRQQIRDKDSNKRTFSERNQFLSNPEIDRSRDRDSDLLESKLSQFKAEASKTRDEIAKSHPDFETIEDVTRTKAAVKATSSPTLSAADTRTPPTSPKKSPEEQSGSEKKREREWYKLLKSAAEKYYYGGKVSRSPATAASGTNDGEATGKEFRSTGIVETDLDTGASREMLDAELVDLEFEKAGPPPRPPLPKSPTANGNGKARSLTNLTSGGGLKFSLPPDPSSPHLHHHGIDIDALANEVDERAKSFEFLLDETQKCSSVPPENQLRQEARQLSEHELRIQRSLQKLNVPDWYRKHGHDNHTGVNNQQHYNNHVGQERSPTDPVGSSSTTTALKLLKRSDYGSANGLAGGWAGLSAYRTPSLSSLQNSGRYTGSLPRSNFVRGRPATMSAMRSSRESLLSPSSTASQSPSAFERCSFTYGMPYSLSRYGQGRLGSTPGASPANSSPPATPGSLSTTASTRKPYLGWRSQERLNAAAGGTTGPPKLSFYRPPAERLAAEVMTLRQRTAPLRPTGVNRPPLPKPPPRAEKVKRETEHENEIILSPPPPSVHDSIREVTDAINQFVSLGQDEPPRPTPRQKSGKKQAVWIESSFVGRKPRVTN